MHRRTFLKRMTWGMAMIYAGLPLARAVAERAEADAPKRLPPPIAVDGAALAGFGPGTPICITRGHDIVYSSIVVRAGAGGLVLRDAMPTFPIIAGATYFVHIA